MSDIYAIRARNLTKEYRLGQQKGRAVLSQALAKPFRRRRTRHGEWFRALDDVSFDVAPGTAVGIIGRNGAGKSTLLKILSRITKPTAGEVVLRGRVGSLLEVGTGFHAELTGRENVFMNGAMLGMRRAEIRRKFDEIVAFAEVERFIDTPVKRYSSGMYVRLAFAVAAHLEPEILLIDEVLAVGDLEFQKKCLGKMGEVAGEGRTVLFVSHNTAAVQQLTSACVLIEDGSVVADGSTNEVLSEYLRRAGGSRFNSDLDTAPRYDDAFGTAARFQWARVVGDTAGAFDAEQDLAFDVGIDVRTPLGAVRISVGVSRFDGTPVGNSFGDDLPPPVLGLSAYRVVLAGLRLAPGRYWVAFGFGRGNLIEGYADYDVVLEAVQFEVLPSLGRDGGTTWWVPSWGPLRFATPVVTELELDRDDT